MCCQLSVIVHGLLVLFYAETQNDVFSVIRRLIETASLRHLPTPTQHASRHSYNARSTAVHQYVTQQVVGLASCKSLHKFRWTCVMMLICTDRRVQAVLLQSLLLMLRLMMTTTIISHELTSEWVSSSRIPLIPSDTWCSRKITEDNASRHCGRPGAYSKEWVVS